MTRSFSDALRRAELLGQGVHPDTHQPVDGSNINYNYYNFSKYNTVNEDLDNSNYSDRNYKGLRLFVNTDKDLLLAQNWEMEPGLLYNLCRDYGTQYVKSVIRRVDGIGDRYFREGEPIEPQRGRYCRAIILKEGQKL